MEWLYEKRPDVVSIRYIELGIALYTGMSALLFLVSPWLLRFPIYDPWREFGVSNWGLLMLTVSFTHIGALVWNGRSQLMSRIFRTIACVGHASIMIAFGMFFIQGGAIWGAILFLFLMPFNLYPVVYRLTAEIKWLREENDGPK